MRKYYKGFVAFSRFRRVSFSWDGVRINVTVVKINLKCTITYISFCYCYFVSYFLNGFTWGLQITLFLLFTLFFAKPSLGLPLIFSIGAESQAQIRC